MQIRIRGIKVLTKIHKQFGHASIENMRRLLNNASLLNSETSKLIEKIYNSCKTCLIYKKPLHRPVVGKYLSDIVLKIKEDINCTWKTALAWAVIAKNCLMNINGFSPHQLVFGQTT